MDANHTRVAILAASSEQGETLRGLLQPVGLQVVHCGGLGEDALAQLDASTADVLLVDLGGEVEAEVALIDALLERSSLPMMFHDSSPQGGRTSPQWARRLAGKLSAMAAEAPVEAVAAVAAEAAPAVPQATPAELNVWVLGASLGGPQAVREFLAAVDADLPVAFVLAQHIGANHVQTLADQLDRISPFRVMVGRQGHALRHGEVVLAPADRQLKLTSDGYVALGEAPAEAIYSPSIDHVMQAVAATHGASGGAIVFSGMGDDGAEGCVAVARAGGVVWAQDTQSCVISSMPDHARKTHTVTYSAKPRDIAAHLLAFYQDA